MLKPTDNLFYSYDVSRTYSLSKVKVQTFWSSGVIFSMSWLDFIKNTCNYPISPLQNTWKSLKSQLKLNSKCLMHKVYVRLCYQVCGRKSKNEATFVLHLRKHAGSSDWWQVVDQNSTWRISNVRQNSYVKFLTHFSAYYQTVKKHRHDGFTPKKHSPSQLELLFPMWVFSG